MSKNLDKSRPLFVYFHSFHNPIPKTLSISTVYINQKTEMWLLGFKPIFEGLQTLNMCV